MLKKERGLFTKRVNKCWWLLCRLEPSPRSSPDFIKLVAIGRVGGFPSVVTGVQAAEQSVGLQQIPENANAVTHVPLSYVGTERERNTNTPCTDGWAEVCRDRNLGLHCHNIQIHQIVEVKEKQAAICGSETHTSTNLLTPQRPKEISYIEWKQFLKSFSLLLLMEAFFFEWTVP